MNLMEGDKKLENRHNQYLESSSEFFFFRGWGEGGYFITELDIVKKIKIKTRKSKVAK
jgi:hypothetical protein